MLFFSTGDGDNDNARVFRERRFIVAAFGNETGTCNAPNTTTCATSKSKLNTFSSLTCTSCLKSHQWGLVCLGHVQPMHQDLWNRFANEDQDLHQPSTE